MDEWTKKKIENQKIFNRVFEQANGGPVYPHYTVFWGENFLDFYDLSDGFEFYLKANIGNEKKYLMKYFNYEDPPRELLSKNQIDPNHICRSYFIIGITPHGTVYSIND